MKLPFQARKKLPIVCWLQASQPGKAQSARTDNASAAMTVSGHVAFGSNSEVAGTSQEVRFSNRPFGVKRFQTIHHYCSVDVAHGLVLLFGIGTKALPSWIKDEVEQSFGRPCPP